jgi:endoglucanase
VEVAVHYPLRLGSAFLLVSSWALSFGAAGCGTLFPSPPPSKTDTQTHPVRLNSLGYLPESPKIATVVAPGGSTFNVRSSADDSVAWNSTMGTMMTDELTGDTLFQADFSEFSSTGSFYIEVPGLGRSATFTVGTDVYNDLLTRAMVGMYGQRCGTDVHITLDGETWGHAACHQHDGSLKYLTGSTQVQASNGGWHDAGDYGKYTTNGAFSAGMMLAAWEQFQPLVSTLSLPIPEHGGALPDFLAEVKWELDWLLTIPSPDGSGGIPHKLTALNFEGFIMPEADMSTRYFTPVGTAATADFVAVMAEAARIYQSYDADFAAKCLAAARLSYTFLQSNTGPAVPSTPDFSTGGYGDSNDNDERTWAAAEMWETTGEADFLTDFETRASKTQSPISTVFDWQNVGNLGMFRYLLSKRDGRNADLVTSLQSALTATAEALVRLSTTNSWGRPMGYSWGANGSVARTAMNLATANALTPDARYTNAIVSGLDHLLGRNHYDRSQITMVGNNPPVHPHHRPSASDSVVDPWPGLLVGGQDCPSGASNCSTAPKYDWQDTQSAPNLNEIAVNWNGALVYAAAAMAQLQASSP